MSGISSVVFILFPYYHIYGYPPRQPVPQVSFQVKLVGLALATVLDGRKTATFIQLDRRIAMMLELQVSSQMPLVPDQDRWQDPKGNSLSYF